MVQPPAPPGYPGNVTPDFQAPAAGSNRSGVTRLVALSVLIVFCALAIIGIVSYVGWNIGPVALGIGIAGAILPVPVLVACFLWLDRYDPSPLSLMLICFLWGAGVATSGALALNTLASHLFAEHGISDNLVATLVAPFVEETLKAAFPLLLFVFYRRAFTGIIDGIVFCGLSATGFAMVENVLYLGGHGYAPESEKGYAAGAFAVTAIFIVRVPLTGFLHPLFTSLTGVGLGIAARSPRRWVRIWAPLLGLLTAMVLHGSWNFMAVLAQNDPYFILYGYFAVFVPIFLGVLGLVLWLRSWEGRLAERILPAYAAAGWFSPPEVAALGTLGRRLSARKWARRVAGDAGQAAMRGYQFAATRLALLRDGANRGLAAQTRDPASTVAEELRLLQAIDAYRRVFAGRDPLAPRAWWQGGVYQIQFPDGVVRTVAAPPVPVVPVPFAFAGAAPSSLPGTSGGPAYGGPSAPPYGGPAPYSGPPQYRGPSPYGGSAPYSGPPPGGPSPYGAGPGSPSSYGPPSYGQPTFGTPAGPATPSYGTPAGPPAPSYGTPSVPSYPTPPYGPPSTSPYGTPPVPSYGATSPDPLYGAPRPEHASGPAPAVEPPVESPADPLRWYPPDDTTSR